jgi:acetate CoA/acetoacetate CoA-transferase alpha subunit
VKEAIKKEAIKMQKQIDIQSAANMVKDGDTVMVGGFVDNGYPRRMIDALLERGVRDLTLICNDCGRPEAGVGKLIGAGRVKRLTISHMRLNPLAIEMMNSGEIEVTLLPQGTLAECIRSAGAGLGGVLTPTGLGTLVAEGKQVIELDGKQYLIEMPIAADVALIAADTADAQGNLTYYGSCRNFNPIMATAANLVIAEAEQVMRTGFIPSDQVHTPGIFVDHIIDGKEV